MFAEHTTHTSSVADYKTKTKFKRQSANATTDLVTRVSQPIETLHVIQEIRKLANIGTCRRNGGIFKQDTHHV